MDREDRAWARVRALESTLEAALGWCDEFEYGAATCDIQELRVLLAPTTTDEKK